MAVLKFKDLMGVWHSIPAIQGASAYEQAQTAGYTGTLEDFYADLVALETAVTDAEQAEVDAQLAQTAAEAARDLAQGYAAQLESNERIMNRSTFSAGQRRPLMTFCDDDGAKVFITKWGPIITEKGIPITACINTFGMGDPGRPEALDWDDVAEWSLKGVEFLSHFHTHTDLTTISEAEIRSGIELTQAAFRAHGLKSDILVYPFGTFNATVQQIVRQYFRAGISVGPQSSVYLNSPPIMQFNILRVSIPADLNSMKVYIDQAISENKWLIWLTHAAFSSFDAATVQMIKDAIDYGIAQGIGIVNMSDGLNAYGNVIDVQSQTNDYNGNLIVDADGVIKDNRKTFVFVNNYSISNSTPPSAFKSNSFTKTSIEGGNQALGFPETGGGNLETYKGINADFKYQLFYPWNNNKIYKRVGGAGDAWGTWERISAHASDFAVKILTANTFPQTTTIDSYEVHRLTIFAVDSGSLYNGNPGIVFTYKYHQNGWSWQELYAYNTNKKYSRYVKLDGAWSDWEKITITPTELAAEMKYVTYGLNYKTEAAAISAYPAGKVCIFPANSSNLFNGKVALVITYNIYMAGWQRQELRVYNSHEVYSRYVVDGSGAWSAWQKISAV